MRALSFVWAWRLPGAVQPLVSVAESVLGRLLALIGAILVAVLFVLGRLVGIEAGLFALAFLAILL